MFLFGFHIFYSCREPFARSGLSACMLCSGGIAGSVGAEEVVAMDAEGRVDPDGSDPGGLHPLLFALFPGSGDDVSFHARPFRGAFSDSCF